MKKTLLQFISAIFVFLIGAIISEYFRLYIIGGLIAYGSIFYIIFILSQTYWSKKTFHSINEILSIPDQRGNGYADTNMHKPPNKLLVWLIIFVFPALMHIVLLTILQYYDPCTGNSGCMSGSTTGFFFILLTLPAILLLLVISLVQVFGGKYNNYRKYLKINITLSLAPFVVGFIGLIVVVIVFN